MPILRYKKGTYITDKVKVDEFIDRLEKCLLDASMEGDENILALLEEIKKIRAYDHNHMHTLEDIEYQIATKDGSSDGLNF